MWKFPLSHSRASKLGNEGSLRCAWRSEYWEYRNSLIDGYFFWLKVRGVKKNRKKIKEPKNFCSKCNGSEKDKGFLEKCSKRVPGRKNYRPLRCRKQVVVTCDLQWICCLTCYLCLIVPLFHLNYVYYISIKWMPENRKMQLKRGIFWRTHLSSSWGDPYLIFQYIIFPISVCDFKKWFSRRPHSSSLGYQVKNYHLHPFSKQSKIRLVTLWKGFS